MSTNKENGIESYDSKKDMVSKKTAFSIGDTVDEGMPMASKENPLVKFCGTRGDVEFEVADSGKYFEMLAENQYSSFRSGIREYLANAETAVLRAERAYGIDGCIQVLWKKGGENKDGSDCGGVLVIYDNGIGFSVPEAHELIGKTHISGVSEDAPGIDNAGNYSGMKGVGMISGYTLVGKDGSFLLRTRSRRNDLDDELTESIGVYFKPQKWKATDAFLEDGKYGSMFEFPVKDNIKGRDIRRAVEKFSEYLDVPVIYEEEGVNGDVIEDEDYGLNDIEDNIGDDEIGVKFENEYVKAVAYPSSSGETLLVRIPIERGKTDSKDCDWNYDLQIKNENGLIVDSNDESKIGKKPIADSKFDKLDKNEKQKYIRYSNFNEDDIKLPEPKTNRDELKDSAEKQKFIDWVESKIQEKINSEINKVYEKLDYNPKKIKDINEGDIRRLDQDSNLSTYSSYKNNYQRKIERNVRYISNKLDKDQLQEDERTFARLLYTIRESVETSLTSRFTSDKKIIELIANNKTVFMCKTYNDRRAKIAKEIHDDAKIVRLDSDASYDYDILENYLGFNKLKDIPLSKSKLKDKYGEVLSDSTINNLGKDYSRETNPKKKTVNVRSSRSRSPSKIKLERIESRASEDRRIKRGAKILVLFPNRSDKNMSDHKSLASVSGVSIACCKNSIYDYLSDLEPVYHIDELEKEIKQATIENEKGEEINIRNNSETIVLHDFETLNSEEDKKILYSENNIYEKFREKVANETNIPKEKLNLCSINGSELDVIQSLSLSRNNIPWVNKALVSTCQSLRLGSDIKIYFRLKLEDIEGTDEYITLKKGMKRSYDLEEVYNSINSLHRLNEIEGLYSESQ